MSKVFVLSAHHRSEFWVSTQRIYLDRFLDVPHRRYFAAYGLGHNLFADCDRVFSYSGSHAQALDLLGREALESAGPNDWLLFLDSDAFPIIPMSGFLASLPPSSNFVAVRRKENAGDLQPHPSFALIKADTYKEAGLSWAPGFFWRNSYGHRVTDVGAEYLRYFGDPQKRAWLPLSRQNRRNFHSLFFAVYGLPGATPIVYHHGAGSRIGPGRVTKLLKKKQPIRAQFLAMSFWLRERFFLGKKFASGFPDFETEQVLGKTDRAFRKAMVSDTGFWGVLTDSALRYFVRMAKKRDEFR